MLRLDAEQTARSGNGFSRRDFLHVGSLGGLGLTLPRYAAAKEAAQTPDSDVNCIMLFLVGGPSQLDTFDLKPKAPAEIRGPFKPIATKVPGIQISEIFPKLASHTDKFSLIRSMYHTATAVHDTGHQMMQTGRLFTGGIEHPHVGCVLGYQKGGRGELPAHVLMPRPIGRTGGNMPHGQNAGYLGKPHDPFVLNADPSVPNFQVPDLLPPDYLPPVRAERRQKLRDQVEASLKSFETSSAAKQMDHHFDLAYRLMSSAKAREAFALEKEPAAVRDRYGRTRFGQCCLMARRLIEAGVRFVTVNMFETVFDELTWDIHGSRPFTDIEEMANQIAPNFDQAYSALLDDLSQRGLLRNTVVVATGEFGRTPKINPAGGRDHHPGVWTMLMGGGPIRGGQIIGESDEMAYAPKSRPTTPAEIAATIYQALGLDPHTDLPGPQGRPIPMVDYAVSPLRELF
ncbi:DUF1501 domain-containing protein [Tuwongella immobilis]|uniref:DUF1501 domain-containing protein n=1 Tax=Tuwongella immobilis TaxID=692036 RepID=A0A6C2YWU9_9BACT|nr:DUF1501 domain-containing protein [Tuwongella immobilis]VIP05623.1 protein containing duf1501 : Uncharacterized protein OS=Solibacter usitatus (strain Ellin6076) GN=Acid_5708 PE=4 SV=1: DUF1501 [Tuwongella immobilis]VTS08602.1 protein containing duf1501 : Uncharacterized protein OS=Solibacter usitatus (strain Ellin6076) GN=Acid_5708 PE=4 SV=1: DUF1501 [Tuwongella immobilis]